MLLRVEWGKCDVALLDLYIGERLLPFPSNTKTRFRFPGHPTSRARF